MGQIQIEIRILNQNSYYCRNQSFALNVHKSFLLIIIFSVLVPIFMVLGLVPFVSWNRRNLSGVLDLKMLVKFFLSIFDAAANGMFLMAGGFAVYW